MSNDTALPVAAGRRLLLIALLAVLATISGLALTRAQRLRDRWPAEADNLYLPSSRLLRAMSLGHTELAADLVAARANVYFGAQLVAKQPHLWLARYLDTAADLDPRFQRLYLNGATTIMYSSSKMTVDSVVQANSLLRRGAKIFPGDWQLPFQTGFNLFFELPRLAGENDPRVPSWRQDGLELLRQVSTFDGIPPYLPSLVARLLTKRGSQELAIKQLEQAYAATSSKETRQQILISLSRLRSQSLTDQLQEDQRRMQELVEQNYPYAPESFNVIAAPRRRGGVDLHAWTQP